MVRFVAIILSFVLICAVGMAEEKIVPAAKTYGKAPTLTEVTAVSSINSDPAKYAKKTVLLSGKVVDMCQHKGCWVELMSADSSKIICRSLDESINFSKDCLGKDIQLQGTVLWDTKAKGTVQMKHEGDAAPHACPAPKVMVSIEGATVAMAAAVPTPATEVTPAAETKEATK